MDRPFLLAAVVACVSSLAPGADAATIAVTVDPNGARRAINPEIYGVNFGDDARAAAVGYPVRRSGGNSTTRYNWQADVHNTAFDYYFMNIPDGDGTGLPSGSTTNDFVASTLQAGAEPIVTISTIGWAPLSVREKRWAFSIAKYGPQTSDECRLYGPNPPFWCTADAGNGECIPAQNTTGWCVANPGGNPAGYIRGNDPTDTSFAIGPQYARDWIAVLRGRFGAAANGGVRYYSLDNEPMLWSSTHRDVHPQPATFDELWQKARDYGTAIKAEDPQAQVFGPVTWGYCDLFSSAADGCHVGADRSAHGGLPFVAWYLQQVCAHQQTSGVRVVDYLDLHYYPQGDGIIDFNSENLGYTESADVSARRLRSLKELYDPNWVSESWISDLADQDANHYSKPGLLPRVRAWIDAYCPGTKLAITEYNWGPDQGATGALAQAEVLAIFGREGVDLATRWVAPEPNSPAERAFRLYLNYDGQGSRVEGDSIPATSADRDALGAYAVDQPGQRTMVLLFNKATGANTAQIALGRTHSGTWRLYRFTGGSDLAEVASGNVNGNTLTLANLPARSANLLVLPAAASGGGSRIFWGGFE